MKIGAASRETGLSIKMIRYYEEIDLIAPTKHTESGYRSYRETDLQQLRFIRRARTLGFSVPHIRSLLELWHKKERDNAHVRQVAHAHIAQLRTQMAALETMLTTLQALVEDCAREEKADCPILSALEHVPTSSQR